MPKVQILAGRRVRPTVTSKKPLVSTPKTTAKTPKETKSGMTGLSIRQLLKATPSLMKANSEDVVIKMLKTAKTKAGLPGVRSKTTTITKRPRHVYDTSFVGKELNKPISAQKHVIASCSCDNFCYYWEVALHHWGSAVIKYSNGEHPDVTNPGLHPGLCKHLYKLGRTIIEEGL